MVRITVTTLLLLLAAAAAAVLLGRLSFRAQVEQELAALLPREAPAPRVLTPADVAALPEAAQRYARYAGLVGRALPYASSFEQAGNMWMEPGGDALPFTARQRLTAEPPGLVWHASVPPMVVRDAFLGGRGEMTIRLLGAIPVGTSRGPEIDQGSLLRWVAESPWLPGALFSETVRLEGVDAHSLRVIATSGTLEVEALVVVDEVGRITRVSARRYREEDGAFALRHWHGDFGEWTDVEGFRVPLSAAVSWTLPSGELKYFEGRLTHIALHR